MAQRKTVGQSLEATITKNPILFVVISATVASVMNIIVSETWKNVRERNTTTTA